MAHPITRESANRPVVVVLVIVEVTWPWLQPCAGVITHNLYAQFKTVSLTGHGLDLNYTTPGRSLLIRELPQALRRVPVCRAARSGPLRLRWSISLVV